MRGEQLLGLLSAVGAILILTRRWTLPRGRTLVLVASVALLGLLRLDLPSIHCIVEGAFSRLSLSFFKAPMLVKLAIAFLPALFFGRLFCGYVCPKGAAQELLFVRRLRLRPPPAVDRALRLVPYLSLAALIAFPVAYGYRLWTDLDPFLWLFQGHGHVPGLVLLGLILPSSVVLCRPFCRYLCPLVPIFRLLSRLAPLRRERAAETCRGCKAGVRACDFDVIRLERASAAEPGSKPACRFAAGECLQCGRCAEACPHRAIR